MAFIVHDFKIKMMSSFQDTNNTVVYLPEDKIVCSKIVYTMQMKSVSFLGEIV